MVKLSASGCIFVLWSYFHFGFFVASSYKPPPPSFYEFEAQFKEERPAKNKFDDIWKMMISNGDELPPYSDIFNFLKNMNLLPLIPGAYLPLIQSSSMFRPWKLERKMLHTRPTHASVQLVFNEEAHRYYTGLFEAPSVDYGLLSLSQGFKVPNLTNFFAMNIRSFRDNVPSSSIIAAFNLISQPNWNIFDYMICTHYNWLMALPLLLLGPTRVGQGWTQYHNQFGLLNVAEYKLNGEKVSKPRFPWGLCFVPDSTLREKFRGHKPSGSAYELVSDVQAGDKLYDIWAIKEPYPLADPSLLKKYSHHIGELRTTSRFITSTYAAQRLLGTHQPFEDDLNIRRDWIPFASPFYLSRAGAVGVYAPLFELPKPDIRQAQLNLMLVMIGVLKAFTTVSGFRQVILQFGITPTELYKSTIQYLLQFVLPERLHPDIERTISPPFKISSQWALNTIRNVALYVTRVGIHPPLGPLRISQLGMKRIQESSELLQLVEAARQKNCKNHQPTYINSSSSNNDQSVNGSGTISFQENACVKHGQEMNKEYLTIENTLFKDVRSLPFNVDAFNLLAQKFVQ